MQASWQTYPPHALTVIFDFTLNLLLTVKFAEEVECNHSIDEYNSSCHEQCHQQLQEVKVTKQDKHDIRLKTARFVGVCGHTNLSSIDEYRAQDG